MIGKRSRPAIGKLAGAIRSGIVDLATSPRSPLDFTPSPKGLKSYDQGGVGLGIIVAMENPNNLSSGGEILAKYALCGPLSGRSSPIPVSPCSSKNKRGINSDNNDSIEMMEGLEEEFTYVTCHGPNKSVTTRVYYDDGEYGNTTGHNRIGFSGGETSRNIGVFRISPARLFEDPCGSNSDFLSSCHSCRKSLHGKDIYMYR